MKVPLAHLTQEDMIDTVFYSSSLDPKLWIVRLSQSLV